MSITQIHSEKSGLKELTLSELTVNEKAEIVHIVGGDNLTQRLSGLGLIPGTIISVISQAPFNGPMQIEVRNTRLAVGRGIADKIHISLL